MIKETALGGFSISIELYEYLISFKAVLELGSGSGTGELSKKIKMISVEHDLEYVGKYDSEYIHAPILNKWYDPERLKGIKKLKYDALLIDGPPGYIGRRGILNHLDLFNTSVPFIVDDCQRPAEHRLAMDLQAKLGRNATFIHCADRKTFAVI